MTARSIVVQLCVPPGLPELLTSRYAQFCQNRGNDSRHGFHRLYYWLEGDRTTAINSARYASLLTYPQSQIEGMTIV